MEKDALFRPGDLSLPAGGYYLTEPENGQQDLIDLVKAQVGTGLEGEAPEGRPSVSLLGDLSEFLPTEDRIRVVSWVEH